MHEASSRAKRKREILGPGTVAEKLAWMVALVRAHRSGHFKTVSRACRAFVELTGYYDASNMVWLDFPGFTDALLRCKR
eukprot:233281-Pyramimonas_sp.AAC.1